MIALALRAFAMTSLVSAQTIWLADRQWLAIAPASWMISFLWFANSSAKRPDTRQAAYYYATGAMLGTLVGALVADWMTR